MDKRKILQPILALAVVGAGVGTLVALKNTKPEAQREEKKHEGTLVEVRTVQAARHEVRVRAQGTVMPAERVVLMPEITGRVIWQNDELVPGGHLRAGAVVLRIDPRDYQLQLEARRAEVSRAELDLRLEKSQQEVARREWEKFGPKGQAPADGGSLALREPQVQTAEVAVKSAKSALDQARRSLDKTVLKSPFNSLVMTENVDEGQLVGPQTQVATLVGTDRFWVQVSVPVESLSHIRIPGRRGVETGSEARVWAQVGGDRVERTGQVLRILPDLDPGGTMARILVGIDDPLALAESEGSDERLPLLLNSYVQVEIAAPPIDDVIEVPRVALRDGDKVYVMDDQSALRIRDVNIVWRRPDSVLVDGGLEGGERIVTSRLPAPMEGMKLRLDKPHGKQAAAGPAASPSDAPASERARAATEAEPSAPPRAEEKL